MRFPYYSMQAHLTANLLFVWLLLKPTPYRAFGAGVVGSLALVLHNPFPHMLFAAPWIIAFARSKDQRRTFLRLDSWLSTADISDGCRLAISA